MSSILTQPLPSGLSFDLLLVEGGEFLMGDDKGDSDEKPVHRVEVSSFYMGKYTVTQALWEAVMGKTHRASKATTVRWKISPGTMRRISSKN